MKIAIYANDDLTSNVIFAPLFELPGVEVALLRFPTGPQKGSRSTLGGALRLLKRVAIRYWLFLVVTNTLFKIFEGITLKFALPPRYGVLVSLRRLAQTRGLGWDCVSNFAAPQIAAELRVKGIDLLVVRIGDILPATVLDAPALGTWCVHSSLLPTFKGIAGEFHALRTFGAPIGSTVFRVAVRLDEGPPLSQVRILREESRSVFHHILTNNVAAGRLLANLVTELANGREISHQLFNEGLQPSYHSWPQGKEVTQLRRSGKRLIDWKELSRLTAASFRLANSRIIENEAAAEQ